VNGQKRFKGWIGEATETAVTIEEDGVLKTVELELIQKSRLAPFDEEKTPKPRLVPSTGPKKVRVEKSAD
jgi:ribosome maturation factor RimP